MRGREDGERLHISLSSYHTLSGIFYHSDTCHLYPLLPLLPDLFCSHCWRKIKLLKQFSSFLRKIQIPCVDFKSPKSLEFFRAKMCTMVTLKRNVGAFPVQLDAPKLQSPDGTKDHGETVETQSWGTVSARDFWELQVHLRNTLRNLLAHALPASTLVWTSSLWEPALLGTAFLGLGGCCVLRWQGCRVVYGELHLHIIKALRHHCLYLVSQSPGIFSLNPLLHKSSTRSHQNYA